MFNIQNNPFLLQTIDLDWDEQPMPLGNLTVCIIAMSSAFHRLECIPLLIERMSTFHDLKSFGRFFQSRWQADSDFLNPRTSQIPGLPHETTALAAVALKKNVRRTQGRLIYRDTSEVSGTVMLLP